MGRRALVVNFRNAAVFTDPARSSDRMISGRDRVKRSEAPRVELPADTLDVRHVANMLHVLMGERPVPSFRKSGAKPDAHIWAMARQARVRITMTGEEEIKTVRKAIRDPWNTITLRYRLNGEDVMVKGGLLYHDRLARFLGPELYGKFLELVSRVSGCSNPKKDVPVHAAIELLNATNRRAEVEKFADLCRECGRTALANLISRSGKPQSIDIHQAKSGSRLNMLVVNKAIEKVRRLSGVIYVPLQDEAVDRLKHGTGVATLLEGGFVSVQRIDDWSEALIHGTKPVEEGAVHVPDKNR